MKLAFFLSMVLTVGTASATPPDVPLPDWVTSLIRQQPQHGRTVIEESVYHGHRAFLVMPSNRAPDSGNEHVLHSEDGKVVCEFGGFAGHVTVGACDLDDVKFVRTLFPRHDR
jgi:hypothetical protein